MSFQNIGSLYLVYSKYVYLLNIGKVKLNFIGKSMQDYLDFLNF